jgi:hypothetical protein
MKTNDLDILGAYVHGALTALHALGVVYNVRRRNWFDVIFHTGWLVYDATSTLHHWRKRDG